MLTASQAHFRSGERFVDRRTGLREEPRPILADVQAVLETYAEFAVDGDHRLVAEAHPRLNRSLVPSDEVRPLVAIEADAVAGPMGKTGNPVVGAEARLGDHLPCGRVNSLARRSG